MSRFIKKLVAVLTCAAIITSLSVTTIFAADETGTTDGSITLELQDFTLSNGDAYGLVDNLGTDAPTTVTMTVNAATAGFYDLSSKLAFTGGFSQTYHLYYYYNVGVTYPDSEVKNYAGDASGSLIEDYENLEYLPNTSNSITIDYDRKFIVPVYLQAGANTVVLTFKSNRRANSVYLRSVTFTPTQNQSVTFNKDSKTEGTNADADKNTSSDYLYLDGVNPPTVSFDVSVDADGYYDLYSGLEFTDFGGDYPYWFKNVSVTYPQNSYAEVKTQEFISQADKPADEKLIGKLSTESIATRYVRKACTILLKKGTNTVKFAVKSPRGNNNIKLYSAFVSQKDNKVFADDGNGAINISTGLYDLKVGDGITTKYEEPIAADKVEKSEINLRGNGRSSVNYAVNTLSDRYTLTMNIMPVAWKSDATVFGIAVAVDGKTVADGTKNIKTDDYPVGTDKTVTISTPIEFDNSNTTEHTLRISLNAFSAEVITLKGATLTKFIPQFSMVDDGTAEIDTTKRSNALEYNFDVGSTSGAQFRGYAANPEEPDKKGNSATYRVINVKEGNYKITFDYDIIWNDSGYSNVAGFIATVNGKSTNCFANATDSDKNVVSGFEKDTKNHKISGVISLADGVNDIVITTSPNSSSHLVQLLNSIKLEKAKDFVDSFDFAAQSFAAGDTVKATFAADDKDLAPSDIIGLIIAQYDKDGNLIGTSSFGMDSVWTAAKDGASASVTADEKAEKISAFLWTKALSPVAEAISISKTN